MLDNYQECKELESNCIDDRRERYMKQLVKRQNDHVGRNAYFESIAEYRALREITKS